MRVLAVEQLANGCTRSRRICTVPDRVAHGERELLTYEVPAAVITAVGLSAFERIAAVVQRGFLSRHQARQRKAAVQALWGKEPTSTIARQLGISEARVRQIKDERYA
jgi:hypothetical protein